MVLQRLKAVSAGVIVAALLATTSSCSSSLSGLPSIERLSPARSLVDSGDKLRVAVQDLKDLNADYVIDETGMISMPMIKAVNVRGLNYREIEQAIEEELRKQQILREPRVSVQPLDLRPIYILGEVNRPGEYPYRQGMTMFSAVSLAGGYTYRAKSEAVEVTRIINGKPVTGRAAEATPIWPGDRIRVTEKWF